MAVLQVHCPSSSFLQERMGLQYKQSSLMFLFFFFLFFSYLSLFFPQVIAVCINSKDLLPLSQFSAEESALLSVKALKLRRWRAMHIFACFYLSSNFSPFLIPG